MKYFVGFEVPTRESVGRGLTTDGFVNRNVYSKPVIPSIIASAYATIMAVPEFDLVEAGASPGW